MKINIKATNLELNEKSKDFIQEKMDMLDKYLGSITPTNCDVEVALTTRHHEKGDIYKAEINLQLPGEMLRVEKEEDELRKAVEKAKDHMVRSITKHKEKKIDKKREGIKEE